MTSLQSRRVLYVGGLEDSVQEPTLRAAMIPFGPIQSIDIVSECMCVCVCVCVI